MALESGEREEAVTQVRSIRKRLATTVIVTTVAALLAASVAFVSIELTRFRARMTREAVTLADVIALNSATGLVFEDRFHTEQVLRALEVQPGVKSAVIYDASGSLFASYTRADEDGVEAPPLREAGHVFEGEHLDVARPILEQEERVGTIVLRNATDEWTERLQQYAVIVLLVLGAATGVAAAAAARLRDQISTPLSSLADGAARLSRGELSVEVPVESRDEIGALARAFNGMAASLRDLVTRIREDTRAVGEVASTVGASSHGLLTLLERQENAADESSRSIEAISGSIADVAANVETLSGTANETSSSVIQMDASIAEVASNMDRLSGTIEGAASSVVEMTASIGEISRTAGALDEATGRTESSLRQMMGSVSEVEQKAQQCHSHAERTLGEAEMGLASVRETGAGMQEIQVAFQGLEQTVSQLAVKSQSIGEVVKVIEGVVTQTNMLALNASIIASQAGEHGRAFAVVGHEMQNLADTTAQSTREIENIIHSLQRDMEAAVAAVSRGSERVQRGVSLTDMAGEVLSSIASSSRDSAGMVGSIVQATEVQSRDIANVGGAMGRVKDMVAHIARATSEQNNASSEITRGVDQMRDLGEDVKRSAAEQSRQSRVITRSVEEVASHLSQIAQATRDQRRGGERIREAIQVFREVTDAGGKRATELRDVVETLTTRSSALQSEIDRFDA